MRKGMRVVRLGHQLPVPYSGKIVLKRTTGSGPVSGCVWAARVQHPMTNGVDGAGLSQLFCKKRLNGDGLTRNDQD